MGTCHCFTTLDGISATAITSNDYPEKAVFNLLNQLILDFRDYHASNPSVYENADKDIDSLLEYPNLEEFFKNWQDPTEADKMMKIEKGLFETHEIMK